MHLTAAIIRDHDQRITIGRSGNEEEEPHDRAAIAARSSRDRIHYAAESIPLELTLIDEALGVRSTPDRSPIERKSWSIVAEIVAFLEADLKPKSRGVEATMLRRKIRSHVASNCHPRPRLLPTFSGLIFFIKPCISLLCSSTFD